MTELCVVRSPRSDGTWHWEGFEAEETASTEDRVKQVCSLAEHSCQGNFSGAGGEEAGEPDLCHTGVSGRQASTGRDRYRKLVRMLCSLS